MQCGLYLPAGEVQAGLFRRVDVDMQFCAQSGQTMLINHKYIVIKHLGSGTFGQVKLSFSLADRRLYAIKACLKSQLGCPTLLSGRRCVAYLDPIRHTHAHRQTQVHSKCFAC
jgi:hypothetical protein